MPATDGFRPSEHGFVFTNSWPSEPAVLVKTPFGKINIGDARSGLCGGMVFAAVDYWHAQTLPPAERPAPETALYSYLVDRLVDSWRIPAGVAQYYQWMNLPDSDRGFDILGRHVVTERGLSWRTAKVQWLQVKADLDRGIPAALGIVTVASARPRDLGRNHQVLACSYQAQGRTVTLQVYDPNRGQRDDIHISFSTSTPAIGLALEHNLGISSPIRGFFRTAYEPHQPPP